MHDFSLYFSDHSVMNAMTSGISEQSKHPTTLLSVIEGVVVVTVSNERRTFWRESKLVEKILCQK